MRARSVDGFDSCYECRGVVSMLMVFEPLSDWPRVEVTERQRSKASISMGVSTDGFEMHCKCADTRSNQSAWRG